MIHPTEIPNDLEIARKARLKPLPEIAGEMGIGEHLLEPYGDAVAKIKLEAIEELAHRPPAKYVVVSAITPTPLGEGKTTTTVGLGQAFSHIGKKATVAIRQPAMGPTFGIKGGAAGGGYSQVVPMEMLNLHLTGDTHAVTAAHNLLSAMLDNHIHQNDDFFHIDHHSVSWRRVLDVNDRSLRNVIIGLGPRADGVIRESSFDITAASEVMAIRALSTSLKDLRERLGRIVVGSTTDGEPVTAEDLHAAGAMSVIMREAIKPNLMQTLRSEEHTSELQSRQYLVCRLLLEKKKIKNTTPHTSSISYSTSCIHMNYTAPPHHSVYSFRAQRYTTLRVLIGCFVHLYYPTPHPT